MKNLRFAVLCFFPIVLAGLAVEGCKKDEPVRPEIPERIKITLIDVAVKEVYLHIAGATPTHNETVALQRNGTTVMTFAAVADTNIADTALTQTTAYQYTARLEANNQTTGTSNSISTQTLAPTSHDFTWQTFLLGDGNGSALSDVALISDTLAYACGEIYLGNDPSAYNVARWNGTLWEPLRIRSTWPCTGGVDYPPLRAVWAFSSSEILFTDGGALFRYDGATTVIDCRMNPLLSGAITKIYGFARNSIYLVAGGGTIIRYDGSAWQRLESGTATRINDAWGVVNPMTGREEVYCAVMMPYSEPGENMILRIGAQNEVSSVKWNLERRPISLWTNRGFPLYVAGEGLFENKYACWSELPVGRIAQTNAIRGTASNNIFVVGSFGLLVHYDGLEWRPLFSNSTTVAYYAAVTAKGNMVVAVGADYGGRAIVTVGKRNL